MLKDNRLRASFGRQCSWLFSFRESFSFLIIFVNFGKICVPAFVCFLMRKHSEWGFLGSRSWILSFQRRLTGALFGCFHFLNLSQHSRNFRPFETSGACLFRNSRHFLLFCRKTFLLIGAAVTVRLPILNIVQIKNPSGSVGNIMFHMSGGDAKHCLLQVSVKAFYFVTHSRRSLYFWHENTYKDFKNKQSATLSSRKKRCSR